MSITAPEPTPRTAPTPDSHGDDAPGRRRWRGTRPTRSTLLAALLTLGLGVALSTQIAHRQSLGLETLRETELVGILDTVTARAARLEAEADELEAERARLAGGDADQAARRVEERIADLGILAGTAAAQGPGVVVTIGGGTDVVSATQILDLVQELRDAGAEAIQIGEVRVVASTAMTEGTSGPQVGGKPVTWPLRVVAIGDPHTLATALAIPGGVEESARQNGATISVRQEKRVLVNALHLPSEPRYARQVFPPGGQGTP